MKNIFRSELFRKGSALFLVTLMIVNLIFSNGSVLADEVGVDVSNILLDLAVTVEQGGNTIEEDDWATISTDEAINLGFSLRVPVLGDGEFAANEMVNRLDTASIPLAKGFSLETGAGPFDLEFGDKKVATLTLVSDAGLKTITANIKFDGDAEIFDATGDNWSDVNLLFNATIKYDRADDNINGGDETVEFISKEFTLAVPALPTVISGEKTGTRTGEFIDWKVKVKGTKGSTDVDIDGYEFRDDITNVGTYVVGSFKVNTVDDEGTAILVDPDFAVDDTTLTYTYPENSVGDRFIYFRTKIKDSVYYSNGNKTVTNTAKVFLDNDQVWSDSEDINFTVEWIKKVGAVSEFDAANNSGFLTWTITANQLGSNLNNAVIEDILHEKLDFVSATWSKYNGAAWDPAVVIVPTDSNSKYSLGNISEPVQLTIKTKLKGGINIGHTVQAITNTATITWDNQTGDGIGSGNLSVDIGLNPISKSVGGAGYDRSTHTIPWDIEVAASDVNVDLRVMDLLVYANSGFDVNNIASYTIEGNTAGGSLDHVSNTNFSSLTPSYNQKYKVGSYTSGDGLVAKIYTIKDGVTPIADLIVVTKAGPDGIDVSGGSQSFSFESIVTNPAIYAKNGRTTVRNYSSLFSANTYINRDNAHVNYSSNILVKDMFTRTNALDTVTNINSGGADTGAGFNYEDRTVTYRLHINGNDLKDFANDLTNVDGVSVGALTLEDTLPAGWEFIEVSAGEMFKIYEGTGSPNGKVTAGAQPADLTFLTPDFTVTGKATFGFTNITKPYVIVLKAKPNDATITTLFNANKTTAPSNNVSIKATNWDPGSSASQDVSIVSTILDKGYTRSDGELTWTIEYQPYEIEHVGLKMEDTLSQGVELKTNAEGELDLANDYIVATKLQLESDGSYSDNGNIPLVLGAEGNLTYDKTTRKLTFIVPTDATDEGFKLVYKTDIVGDSGTTITNSVKLIGGDITIDPVVSSYTVRSVDASATMTRSGWVEITKTDSADDSLLGGAEFTLLTESGQSFRTGITSANGKVTLRGLPVGNYTFSETTAPAGYNSINTVYNIGVSEDSGSFATSINGQTGDDSNKLTIENIKTGTVGTLKISKVLSGNATDDSKEFEFSVTVGTINGIYDYTGDNGKANGTIEFSDGVATLTLKGGESVSILELPKESEYSVVENNYTADGYTTTKTGDTGTIQADVTSEVEFTNRRNISSSTPTPTPTPEPTPEPTPTPEPSPTPIVKEETTTPDKPVKDKIEVPEEHEIEVEKIPENGTISVDPDGTWEYTPDPEFIGKDSFVIVVTDPDGLEEEFFIDIFVEEIPEDILELPATGGIPIELFNLVGFSFVGLGLASFKKKTK